LIVVELFQKRAVCLSGDEMVDHINGGGKKDLDIGITGGIGDAFRKEALTGTGVTDHNHISVLFDKLQVKEVEDLSFLIPS